MYSASDDKHRKKIEEEHKRLESFYNFADIVEPYWAEDKIPEDIIIRFVDFLTKQNYTDIKLGKRDFPIKFENVNLSNKNIFNHLGQLENVLLYTDDRKYCLKLPYNDLPYTFLLTNQIDKNIILRELNLEGFFADSKTKTYWNLEV